MIELVHSRGRGRRRRRCRWRSRASSPGQVASRLCLDGLVRKSVAAFIASTRCRRCRTVTTMRAGRGAARAPASRTSGPPCRAASGQDEGVQLLRRPRSAARPFEACARRSRLLEDPGEARPALRVVLTSRIVRTGRPAPGREVASVPSPRGSGGEPPPWPHMRRRSAPSGAASRVVKERVERAGQDALAHALAAVAHPDSNARRRPPPRSDRAAFGRRWSAFAPGSGRVLQLEAWTTTSRPASTAEGDGHPLAAALGPTNVTRSARRRRTTAAG